MIKNIKNLAVALTLGFSAIPSEINAAALASLDISECFNSLGVQRAYGSTQALNASGGILAALDGISTYTASTTPKVPVGAPETIWFGLPAVATTNMDKIRFAAIQNPTNDTGNPSDWAMYTTAQVSIVFAPGDGSAATNPATTAEVKNLTTYFRRLVVTGASIPTFTMVNTLSGTIFRWTVTNDKSDTITFTLHGTYASAI